MRQLQHDWRGTISEMAWVHRQVGGHHVQQNLPVLHEAHGQGLHV